MKLIHTPEEVQELFIKLKRELEVDKMLFELNSIEEVTEGDMKAAIKNIKDTGWHQGYITAKYEMAEKIALLFELNNEVENQ